MNKNIDPIPLFDYKNGDLVTASAVNTVAIKVFNKFNFLNTNNIDVINTGFYYDAFNDLYYVNACGTHDTYNTRHEEMDVLLEELVDDINKIINLNTGV